MKIVVIDDEPDICEVITISFGLRWPDATVMSAGTGRKGLELCRQDPPDVIILDVGLPDIDGFEVCHCLRRDGVVTPIIMMSAAHTAPYEKVRGLDVGADDYISKPFHFDELLARIRAAARRKEILQKLLHILML